MTLDIFLHVTSIIYGPICIWVSETDPVRWRSIALSGMGVGFLFYGLCL